MNDLRTRIEERYDALEREALDAYAPDVHPLIHGLIQRGRAIATEALPDTREPDSLDALRELSDAATPGPWGAYVSYSGESGTPDEVGLFVNDKAHDVDGEKRTIVSDFSLYASEPLPDLELAAAAVNYVRARLSETSR